MHQIKFIDGVQGGALWKVIHLLIYSPPHNLRGDCTLSLGLPIGGYGD